jgi:hypothetical protein
MQQQIKNKRPAEIVGELISREYARQLIDGFTKEYPNTPNKIFISCDLLNNAVKGLSNVSGIRFMYGMVSPNKPDTKIILLIPCNNTSGFNEIPNTIVQPQGYLNHRGELISLKQTWQFLYNHAVYTAAFQPELKFHKIVRGVFFGKESLGALLTEYTSAAAGIDFYFGYDETIAEVPQRHKPVLNPVHYDGKAYDVFMDVGHLCPPFCDCGWPGQPPCKEVCIVSNSIGQHSSKKEVQKDKEDIFRKFRDEYMLSDIESSPLVEMYYYVSPALVEAIQNTGTAKEIYISLYENEISKCNLLIADKKYNEAKELFEETMDKLMQQYLWADGS